MKYKLKKDTPTIKSGTIFEEIRSDFDNSKELRIIPTSGLTSPQFSIDDIINFDEWFKEIEEKPKSYQWKPKENEEYYFYRHSGVIKDCAWFNDSLDNGRFSIDNVFKTEKEAEKQLEWRKAWTTLKYSSDFKPNWDNHKQEKYTVKYCYNNKELFTITSFHIKSAQPVYFKTEKEAKKSIENHEREWKIVLGVE